MTIIRFRTVKIKPNVDLVRRDVAVGRRHSIRFHYFKRTPRYIFLQGFLRTASQLVKVLQINIFSSCSHYWNKTFNRLLSGFEPSLLFLKNFTWRRWQCSDA